MKLVDQLFITNGTIYENINLLYLNDNNYMLKDALEDYSYQPIFGKDQGLDYSGYKKLDKVLISLNIINSVSNINTVFLAIQYNFTIISHCYQINFDSYVDIILKKNSMIDLQLFAHNLVSNYNQFLMQCNHQTYIQVKNYNQKSFLLIVRIAHQYINYNLNHSIFCLCTF